MEPALSMRRESIGKIFICKPTHLSRRREYKKQNRYNFIGNIDIQKKRAESRKLPALFFRLYHSSLWHMNERAAAFFAERKNIAKPEIYDTITL